MAIIITDDCINCGACEPECPNTAIYEGAAKWKFSDGTGFTGKGVHPTAGNIDADKENDAISMDLYFISPEKCFTYFYPISCSFSNFIPFFQQNFVFMTIIIRKYSFINIHII